MHSVRAGMLAMVLMASLSCQPPATSIGGKKTVRITNWGGAGDDGPYEKLVAELYAQFERENPDIDLVVENIPGEYVHKSILNFLADAQPEVMVLDASSAAIFINNGVLTDLAPMLKESTKIKHDDYFPNVMSIASVGQKVFAIPIDFTPMVVYYNKDLFDAKGVPYPKPGWTLEDFLDTCIRLNSPDSGKYGFVFNNWMPAWIMWLWNGGGNVLSSDGRRAAGTLDSNENVATITYLRDLIKKHRVAPSFSQAASMGVDLFANGKAAMTVSGHWALVGYKKPPNDRSGNPAIDWKRLGVVELPSLNRKSSTVMYEAGLAIPKGVKHSKEAWRFIEFWCSKSIQQSYNSSGIGICARKDVSRSRAIESEIPDERRIENEFLKVVPTARPPFGSWVEGYEVVEKHGAAMMDSVINNDADPGEALRAMAERIDREFAKRL